jgi:hypothetical protein
MRLMTVSAWRVAEGTSDRLSELLVDNGEPDMGATMLQGRAAIRAWRRQREERRSDLFRAWFAQVWRWVLLAAQAMAGCDLTGQFTGWWPVQDSVVSDGPPGADEPRAALAEVAPLAGPEQLLVFTPAELARLRALRARLHASRGPFTTCELARLRFVRWLHQTGRLTP